MLGIGSLVSAIARLAGSCNGLADTLDAANAGLRARLLLDADPDHPPALPAPAEGADAPDQGGAAPARKNGRAKANV